MGQPQFQSVLHGQLYSRQEPGAFIWGIAEQMFALYESLV